MWQQGFCGLKPNVSDITLSVYCGGVSLGAVGPVTEASRDGSWVRVHEQIRKAKRMHQNNAYYEIMIFQDFFLIIGVSTQGLFLLRKLTIHIKSGGEKCSFRQEENDKTHKQKYVGVRACSFEFKDSLCRRKVITQVFNHHHLIPHTVSVVRWVYFG